MKAVLNVNQLKKIQEERKKVYDEIYLNIFNRCKKHIENLCIKGETNCQFEIPQFILGYPPIDVSKCSDFLLTALNKQVYAKKIDATNIYISWSIEHIK